jgi:hypothetical protein
LSICLPRQAPTGFSCCARHDDRAAGERLIAKARVLLELP